MQRINRTVMVMILQPAYYEWASYVHNETITKNDRENPIYLMDEYMEKEELDSFIGSNFETLFKAELSKESSDWDSFPKLTKENFESFFDIQFSEIVADLASYEDLEHVDMEYDFFEKETEEFLEDFTDNEDDDEDDFISFGPTFLN